MFPVIRRQLHSLIALVMLLASLCSTEAAEAWSRVADATITRSQATKSVPRRPADHGLRHGLANERTLSATAAVSTASPDQAVTDIPVWTFSHTPAPPAPRPAFALGVVLAPVAFATETRGPPVQTARFIRPPLRAPPVA